METKIEKLEINIKDGVSASVEIEENCYVTIDFGNNKNPVDLSKEPKLILKALIEIKKSHQEYEPKVLLFQTNTCVIYYFKRIL
jgi:hypothetical protein